MDCKKCGAQLEDDVIFCSKCGARVDGKTNCKNCGREIAEGSVFCSYCGKRQDGKHACNNCGTAFLGNFCPKCGKPFGAPMAQARPAQAAQARPAVQPKPAPVHIAPAARPTYVAQPVRVAKPKRDNTATKNTLNVLKQSLLYGALCIMFICCFFVSMNLVIEAYGARVSEASGATSFYFLIDSFKEVKEVIAESGTFGKDYFVEYEVAMWLSVGLMALCVAVIMVISIVCFIIGTVKYVKAMMNKTPVSMSKYVVTPAIINLAAMVFLRALMSAETSGIGSDVSIRIAFGAVPILEVVFVSVLLCGAAVLHLITNKVNGKQILNLSLNAGGLALAFILLETLTANATKMGLDDVYESYNAGGAFIGVMGAIGVTPSESIEIYGNSLALSMVMYIMYTACFVLAAALMIKFAKNILNNKAGAVSTCVLSGVTAFVALAYLIVACILRGEKIFAGIGASPICAIIFSLFVLAMAIIIAVLLKEKPAVVYEAEDYAYAPYEEEQYMAESVVAAPVAEQPVAEVPAPEEKPEQE